MENTVVQYGLGQSKQASIIDTSNVPALRAGTLLDLSQTHFLSLSLVFFSFSVLRFFFYGYLLPETNKYVMLYVITLFSLVV